VFYVVVPDGAVAPTVAEVMNQTASGGAAPLACGQTYVVANTPKSQTVATVSCYDDIVCAQPPPFLGLCTETNQPLTLHASPCTQPKCVLVDPTPYRPNVYRVSSREGVCTL
jgi:hypothetical protein